MMRPYRSIALATTGGLLLALFLSAGCGSSSATRANTDSSGSADVADGGDAAAKDDASSATGQAAQDSDSAPVSDTASTRREVSARARNISFDTLKFNMEKRERFESKMITPMIKALDGRRVKIRGFMLPSPRQRGITSFVLMRDNQECCFGPGAALFDAVAVQMAADDTAEYSYPPITVDGVLHIDPIENPNYGASPLENSHIYIYRMDDAHVSRR
jgi:hypothetical protein